MEDPLGYAGKHVVVSGAASGMGEATARILVDLGARVTGLDLKSVSADVERSVSVNLTDRASIEQAAAEVPGEIDAVFSCAGLYGRQFSALDTILVNFVGARQLVELLVPRMPAGGSIVAVASSAALGWQRALPVLLDLIQIPGFDGGVAWVEAHPEAWSWSSYGFSKQAVNAWVGWRSPDLLARGIRLNCTNPGPTDTPMLPKFHAAVTKEKVDQALGPIGRYATSDEQAWALVLLNSPRLSYVSGETLWVDGGFLGALTTGRQKSAPEKMARQLSTGDLEGASSTS
jgi:NAD(P)-dependent dehydrogenase (short-subunit alcohol dehydrogenase family)